MNKSPIDLMHSEILIVDDDPVNLNVLRQALESEGYSIIAATGGTVALQIAAQTQPELILLDILMPEIDGFETCLRLKADKATADIPVIFITAKVETEDVVEGFRVGGVDYITKPFKNEEVLIRVQTHLTNHRLTQALLEKNRELQEQIAKRQQAEDALKTADEQLEMISQREAERWGIEGFIGRSQTIAQILKAVSKLQTTGTMSALILGESGTGKELIARAIHFGGPRGKRPFIPVNCSAIPKDLAESEFFGHLKGAFTGANTDRKGHFELADSGTLFLDEIGDMPLELQAKLLRVLDDGYVTPVGGTRKKHVDVRVLAATNANLQAKVAEGTFREDLYHRLAGFTVTVPPLRERKEDIPLLAEHFLDLFATDDEMGIHKPNLSQEALSALESYSFPGNVRELKNIIARALLESDGKEIQPEHLHFVSTVAPPSTSTAKRTSEAEASEIPLNLNEAEAYLIKRALRITGDNISEAARLLGISRKRIYRKLEQET